MDHLISRYFVVNVPTAAAAVIIPANANRRYLRMINLGLKIVYVNFGGTATNSADFVFNASTVSEEFRYADMGGTLCVDISAIAATGTSKLAVIEGFSVPDAGSGTVGQSQSQFGMS